MEAKDEIGIECTIFKNLDLETLTKVRMLRKSFSLKKGDYLFTEGMHPKGIFGIHEGHLKIIKIGSDGKEQIIYLSKPGDIVGWQQLNCQENYSTTAVAVEKVEASFIAKDDFFKLIKETPSVTIELTKYLCDEMLSLEAKVLELSQKSVRERLAANIILLHQKYGIEQDNKIIIAIPLTREDFANLIGTNTETVIKLISEFRKEGIIDIINRRILILEIQQLKKIADFYK